MTDNVLYQSENFQSVNFESCKCSHLRRTLVSQMIDVKDETWALAGMSVVRRRPWYLLVNCSTHDRAAGTGNAQSPIVDRWVDGTSVVGQSTDSRRRRAADLWYVCRRLSVCLSVTHAGNVSRTQWYDRNTHSWHVGQSRLRSNIYGTDRQTTCGLAVYNFIMWCRRLWLTAFHRYQLVKVSYSVLECRRPHKFVYFFFRCHHLWWIKMYIYKRPWFADLSSVNPNQNRDGRGRPLKGV